MGRSLKKGTFVNAKLLKAIDAMDAKDENSPVSYADSA